MLNRNKTKSTRTCHKGRRQHTARQDQSIPPVPATARPLPPAAGSINYSSENFHILQSIQNKSGRRYRRRRLHLRFGLRFDLRLRLPCSPLGLPLPPGPVALYRSTAVDLTSNDCPQNGRMPIPAARNGSNVGGRQSSSSSSRRLVCCGKFMVANCFAPEHKQQQRG